MSHITRTYLIKELIQNLMVFNRKNQNINVWYLIRLCIMLGLMHFSCWITAQTSNQLITCGDDQVIIFDLDKSIDTTPHIIWQWKATKAPDLPEGYRQSLFKSIDECKPIKEGAQILITSSSDGVAIVDVSSKQVQFYAQVGNAHSAEWLPGGRIAVAGSTHDQGNRISLFDVEQSETVLYRDSLYSGHGLVWDENRQLLYALGYDELRAYRLHNWDSSSPSLELSHRWKIPGISGHDLAPSTTDPNRLILSEHESVWTFDKSSYDFNSFQPLQKVPDVKAVSLHPASHRLAYIKAETSWWSHRVYLQDPSRWISFPDVHLYKVRWRTPLGPK